MVFPDGMQHGQVTGLALTPGLSQRRARINFTINGMIKSDPTGTLPNRSLAQLSAQAEGGMTLLTG